MPTRPVSEVATAPVAVSDRLSKKTAGLHSPLEKSSIALATSAGPNPRLAPVDSARLADVRRSILAKQQRAPENGWPARQAVLSFRLTDHQVVFVTGESIGGTVTVARSLEGADPGIYYRALAENGAVLASGYHPDPTLVACCLPHAKASGQLHRFRAEWPDASFRLRVPEFAELRQIELFRATTPNVRNSAFLPENSIGVFPVE